MIGVLAPLVLILCGAAALLALEASGAKPADVVPGPLCRGATRLVASERAFAAGLGWPARRWLGLRALVLLTGVVAGVVSGVPVLLVLYVFLGATAPRFLLATLVERRRVQQARAFLSFMAQVAERLRARDLELAAVVRAAARDVPHEVAALLAPVAAAGGDVFAVLARQVGRQGSTPLERCCALLQANRERDLGMLSRLIEALVASLEAELDGEDQRVASRAESRWTTAAMGAVVIGFAAVLNTVSGVHDRFQTPQGQLGLVVAMLVFAATAAVMGLLLRSPGMSGWDVERMHRELFGGEP